MYILKSISLKLHYTLVAFFFYHSSIDCFEHLQKLSDHIMISRALYIAADLELADYLQQPLSLKELAERTNSHYDSLKRLMRYLMKYEIFSYDENGNIQNNEPSLFLKKDHPQTIRPFILHDDPTRWNALGNLGFSIKTGNPSFNELYQTDFFSYLENNTALSQRFDEAMTIISQKEDNLIAATIAFSGILADIGGGKGQLLECIHTMNPSINELILFDLAQVHHNLTEKPWIRSVSGSFFEPLAIKADIFILKRIIHDWNDEKALQILRNVADTMDSNSILYIIDAVIDQCQDKKRILDIDLRLLSIFGGQERTFSEWQQLCDSANLEIVSIQELTSISHVIRCKRKEAQASFF